MPSAISSSVETQRLWRSRRLRRHQDQRLAEVALQLPAQDVEVVRRRRAVGDLHVVLGAHLQEALEAGGGMLRTLALVAVRQQADEARHAQPLALARRDELVEHHLRAVGEVAELRLPQGQRVGLGQGVAVLEAEHRLFREHRVDDLVAGLALADVVERRVALLVLLVDQHASGAARRCRARRPGRRGARGGPRASSEPKASASAIAQSMPSPVSIIFLRLSRKRWIVRWTWKPSGTVVSACADLLERLDRDAGLAAARIVRRPRARP